MARHCIFCANTMSSRGYDPVKNPDGQAREHCIADWLQKLLGIDRELVTRSRAGTDGPVHDLERIGELYQKGAFTRRMLTDRLQNVCGRCNSGWMSALEVAVAPILTPLIDGSRLLESLTTSERDVLTRWALKTVFVIASVHGKSLVNRDHVLSVMRQEPLNAGVSLHGYHGSDGASYWLNIDQNYAQIQIRDDATSGADLRRSFKATLRFKRLALTVLFNPRPGRWRVGYWEGAHQLIYATTLVPTPIPIRLVLTEPRWPLALHLSLTFSSGPWRSELHPNAVVPAEGGTPIPLYTHEHSLMEVTDQLFEAHKLKVKR